MNINYNHFMENESIIVFRTEKRLEAKIDSSPIIPLLLQYHRLKSLDMILRANKNQKSFYPRTTLNTSDQLNNVENLLFSKQFSKRTTKDKHIYQKNHETANSISLDFQQTCFIVLHHGGSNDGGGYEGK